jgi:2',3'-cyclic-nucleotide 3'-phosphodiesterase
MGKNSQRLGSASRLTTLSAGTGLSLWLMPSPAQRAVISSVMPARPMGSSAPASYPRFDPHITLCTIPAGPEDKRKFDALRASIPERAPFPIRFQSLERGPTFTRSIFIAVQMDAELRGLEEHIRQAVNEAEVGVRLEGPPPSYPHMSFAYIDDAEAYERERLQNALLNHNVVKRIEDGVTLQCGQQELAGFEASEIWIVNTGLPVERWEALESIVLQ